MKHNSYVCSPHVDGCDCPDKEHWVCNPYWLAGFCPTDGEGKECSPNKDVLVRVPESGLGMRQPRGV